MSPATRRMAFFSSGESLAVCFSLRSFWNRGTSKFGVRHSQNRKIDCSTFALSQTRSSYLMVMDRLRKGLSCSSVLFAFAHCSAACSIVVRSPAICCLSGSYDLLRTIPSETANPFLTIITKHALGKVDCRNLVLSELGGLFSKSLVPSWQCSR